jgi:hypothetical protein
MKDIEGAREYGMNRDVIKERHERACEKLYHEIENNTNWMYNGRL